MDAGRERARRLVRRVARRAGLQTVRADFNSPLVDPLTLSPETWERPAPMPGLNLDLDRQLEEIERRLARFFPELRDEGAFKLANPMYGALDAHVLYALVRQRQPMRVLELGSGYSTLVIQQALAANGEGARHEIVDPYPSPLLTGIADRVAVRPESAATVERTPFEALGPNDMLFVDTTHTVRPGGEVVRIVLELLATLRPGVIVHFHDFFRPFEYPRALYEQFDVHWQEHYLLQGFLAYNPGFAVLLANHALWRLRRRQILRLLPGLAEEIEPSALWLERRASEVF